MGVVAFVVRFAGLFGGYAVASGPALTLAFVLAVALPTTDSPLPDRLVGWIAGGVVAALASVLLWPAHERRAISAALASDVRGDRRPARGAGAGPAGSGVGPLADRAHDELRTARARWRSTARRPVGPSIHDRAVVRAIDHTAWTLDLARLFATRGNVDAGDVELLRSNATDLRAAADALRSNAPVAVGTGVALRQQRIAALEAEVRAAAGDAAQAPEVAARLERAFASLAISSAVLSLAADIATMHGQDVTDDVPLRRSRRRPLARRVRARAAQLVRAELTPDGFWFARRSATGWPSASPSPSPSPATSPTPSGSPSARSACCAATRCRPATRWPRACSARSSASSPPPGWSASRRATGSCGRCCRSPCSCRPTRRRPSTSCSARRRSPCSSSCCSTCSNRRAGRRVSSASATSPSGRPSASSSAWCSGRAAPAPRCGRRRWRRSRPAVASSPPPWTPASAEPTGDPAEDEVVRARRAAIGADRRAGEAYVAFLGERGQRRMPPRRAPA